MTPEMRKHYNSLDPKAVDLLICSAVDELNQG